MKTFGRYAVAFSAVLVAASLATAQNSPPTFCEQYKQDYLQGAMWPTQYVGPPRASICSTFDLMAQNGWRRQNLLGQYHFKPDSSELSNAGQLKVQWVLTQTPTKRRTVYVERGATEEQTAERVASVQQWAAGLGHIDGTPTVSETSIVDYGRPAAAVDAVFTGWTANQPAPVLPKASSGSSSSTGSN